MKITKKLLREMIEDEMHVLPMQIGQTIPAHGSMMPPVQQGHSIDPDGYEGSMAKNNLYNLKDDAAMLCGMIQENENLEPWVEEKIAVAASMINSVARYMKGEKMRPQG